MSYPGAMLSPMKELEKQIRLARIALTESKRIEEEHDYDDAMLSMERTYCEGQVDALEFVYVLMNGHEYSGE